MKDYHINVSYSDEDGGYIADIPDLESCSVFGPTPGGGGCRSGKAKEAWLRSAREEGKPVPPSVQARRPLVPSPRPDLLHLLR